MPVRVAAVPREFVFVGAFAEDREETGEEGGGCSGVVNLNG